MAVTQAAARCPERIASIVYLAAFAPRDGESCTDTQPETAHQVDRVCGRRGMPSYAWECGAALLRFMVMLHSSQAEPAAQAGVVRIRPDKATATRQGVPAFVGVSARTAGAASICMNLIELAPGAAARPHAHVDFETAIHMIEGMIELWHGTDLEHRVVLRAGDFVFIAPGVMHQPRNASMTSTVRAVVARNTPDEQESVVLRDEAGLVAIG